MNKAEKIWCPVNYKDSDEGSIVELMKDDIESRGSKSIFDNQFWNWKYKQNNANFFPNWIKLAKSKKGDFIGGHYALIPAFLKANKNIVLSAQSVDTLTHKSFRRQGVFTELAELCYAELKKDNVDIIYGYPNDNSYPGFVKKLSWKHIFTIFELGYILDVNKLVDYKYKGLFKKITAKIGLKLLFKSRDLRNYFTIDRLLSFQNININEIDTAFVDKIISRNYSFYVDRSKDYLKWRYIDNPYDKDVVTRKITKNNMTVGYYVLKFKTYAHRNNISIAHIMELVLDDNIKNIYPSVFHDITKLSKNKNATLIYAYSHSDQIDYNQFKRYGFLKLDNKNFIIRVFKDEEKYHGIFEAKNWYISQGDSDRA